MFTRALISLILFISHETEEDFRRTACTSLLQHVVETSHWWTDKEEGQGQKAKDRAPDGKSLQ